MCLRRQSNFEPPNESRIWESGGAAEHRSRDQHVDDCRRNEHEDGVDEGYLYNRKTDCKVPMKMALNAEFHSITFGYAAIRRGRRQINAAHFPLLEEA